MMVVPREARRNDKNEDRLGGAEDPHPAAPSGGIEKATTRMTYSAPVFLKAWAWRAFGTIQVSHAHPVLNVAAAFNSRSCLIGT